MHHIVGSTPTRCRHNTRSPPARYRLRGWVKGFVQTPLAEDMASKNSRYSDTQLPRPLRAPRPNRTVAARPPAAHDSSKQDRIRSFVEIDDTDSPYALSETVDVVYCDTPTGDLVVDLPSVALANGQILRVCLNSGSGTVTLNPDGADTVDGDTELVIPYVGDVVTLHPRTSESNWRIV